MTRPILLLLTAGALLALSVPRGGEPESPLCEPPPAVVPVPEPEPEPEPRRKPGPRARLQDPRRKIQRVVIHHTAGSEQSVEAIRRFHRARGFRDIAYHYVVFPDGVVEAGRPVTERSAGVWGRHDGLVEIVLVGKLHQDRPTPAQWTAAVRFTARWLRRLELPYWRISGHREHARPGHGTLCPGVNMTWFRKEVRKELQRPWTSSKVRAKRTR